MAMARTPELNAPRGLAAPEEGSLVRRMAGGDQQALEMLATRYHRRLYTYLLRLTGDPFRAEELLQDVLLAAWQGAARFRGDAQVSTWLLGIAHHKAVDALRRRPQAGAAGTPEELGALPSTDPDPHEVAEGREVASRMGAALRSLPAIHRATLELVFFHGLSLQEAAEVTGVPIGTVKSRIHQARRHLRQAMDARGGHDDGTR